MHTDGRKLSSNKNERTDSREFLFHSVIKIVLIIAFYFLFTRLFYRQAVEYNGEYWSDLTSHISFAKKGGNYSLLFLVMGIICRFPFSDIAIALFESSIVVLTFLLAEKYLRTQFRISRSITVCISAGMLFLCSIYIPHFYPYYYNGTLITQPWHNITYFGMRLFSIPVFFHTLHILDRYRERFTWKDWMTLAVPLLLSASIKPNFLVDYSLTLLCVLIVDFVRDCLKKTLNITSFFKYVSLGSVVFPAIGILLYQMRILYGGNANAENGIKIVFLTSEFFSQGIITAIIGIIRDSAFLLLLMICGHKHFSRKERFIGLLYFVTLVQMIILEETGARAGHGNFTWGMYNVGYLLFLYMVPKFIQLVRMSCWRQKSVKEKCFVFTGSCLLCAHLLFGINYFMLLLLGRPYGF